jgi:hypothetical protein
MNKQIISLLTHERLIVRFFTSWSIGTMILFAAWFISDAWLPGGFLRVLPGMAISPVDCDIESLSETIKTFLWNLTLTGGLCVLRAYSPLGAFHMVTWSRGSCLGFTAACWARIPSSAATRSIQWG